MRALLALAFCICAPRLATAQAMDAITPYLEFAVKGGGWADSTAAGEHRVLVYSGGFEHVISVVYIQWIRDPRAQADTATLVQSVAVAQLNRPWRVSAVPVLRSTTAGTTFTIHFVDPHDSGQPEQVCVVTAGTPSNYRVSCGPQ